MSLLLPPLTRPLHALVLPVHEVQLLTLLNPTLLLLRPLIAVPLLLLPFVAFLVIMRLHLNLLMIFCFQMSLPLLSAMLILNFFSTSLASSITFLGLTTPKLLNSSYLP